MVIKSPHSNSIFPGEWEGVCHHVGYPQIAGKSTRHLSTHGASISVHGAELSFSGNFLLCRLHFSVLCLCLCFLLHSMPCCVYISRYASCFNPHPFASRSFSEVNLNRAPCYFDQVTKHPLLVLNGSISRPGVNMLNLMEP